MSEKTPSIEKLEKQIRVLKKKLDRSEWHRVDLENQHDRDQHLYRRLHADLEAARRETEVEAALERVRTRAMAMQTPEELSDISETVFAELKALGFTELRNTEIVINHDTEASITSYYYSDYGVTGVIDVDYTTNPTLAAWAQEMQKANDAFVEIVIAEDEIAEWRAYRLSLGYVPDPKLDDATAVYYYSYSIGLGALSISSFQPVDEEHLSVLEQFRNVFNLAYQRYVDIARAKAQAREAQIQLALERVRARAMAMHSSDELLEVIFKIHQEYAGLGLPCGAFWHTRYTPESYHKALTGIDGQKLAAIMELPRDFSSNPALAAWERGDEKIGVFKFDTEGACQYLHHMVTKGKFHEVDPEAITEEMIRENDGWTFVQARTSHGEIGYSLWGETEPSQEAKDVLVRFAKTFDLAYQRYEDIAQAEARAHEAQIQLALERIRAQSMLMQHSSELVATSAVFHEQLLVLGVPTEFSYVWLPDEAAGKHQFWATWTEEEDGAPVHRSRAITYDLDKEEPYTAACFAAWASDDPIHVDFISPTDVEHFFATWEELLREAEHLRSERFPDGIYYAEGYMQYGCFGINIRREPTEAERDILRRFAVEFERAYTRFLDLRRAEAQAREAEIEAALERVRSRTMAMHHSDEIAEVASVTFEQFQGLAFPSIRRISIGVMDTEANTMSFWASATTEGRSIRRVTVPMEENATVREIVAGWRAGKPYFSHSYEGTTLREFVAHITQHGWEYPAGEQMPERLLMNFVSYRYGLINASTYEPIGEDEYAILQRFARVFEQTYTRFLDLKQAEAQAREAEIEASLERVRSRAMAMHSSDDISDATAVVFTELEKLGISTLRCGINIIHDSGHMDLWTATATTENNDLRVLGRLHRTMHPMLEGLFEAWKAQQPLFTHELAGEELQSYYQALRDAPEYDLPQDARPTARHFAYLFIFPEGGLYYFVEQPLPEASMQILKRFTAVFAQTYQRYLDLKKAEEQAREAEIEASLERVRSRAMAMHSSDDISDATAVVFAELERLGITTLRCGVIIIDDTRHMDTWTATATSENQDVRVTGRIDMTIHPLLEGVFAAWKAQQPSFVYEMVGEDMHQYYQAIASQTGYPLPEQRQLSARQFCYTFFFPEGALFAFAEQPLAEASRQVFQRFAAVFALTYRRYLDLQKAEEQAREAQIEAALERVRSRTMAMQRSEELSETSALLFAQIKELGIETWSSGFNIWEDDERACIGYNATPAGGIGVPIRLPLTEDPFFRTIYEAKKRGDELLVFESEGESLAETYRYMFTLPVVKDVMQGIVDEGFELPEYQVTHCGFFSHGHLMFITQEPYPEAWDIFRRFTKVFEQTYTRFLDLKKSEEQAQQARQQASLDRVRAEIASMRNADDLQAITPLIWRELTTLGVPFFRCGVFIIDEAEEAVHVYLTTPEGKALAVLPLGFNDAPIVAETVAHWRQGSVYVEEWEASDMQAWTAFLQERGLIQQPTRYLDAETPPEHLALHFVPFEQGMLYVGSTAPLDEEAVELVQALADAFAIAYARYEDFQRLEAKNREVEAAMNELKATQQQLIQSEKMASLGALTAGIAHEIKNPLNFVNNFAALSQDLVDELEEETDPEEIQAILADLKLNAAKIEEHGKRADSIVRSMMQHARAGSGEREMVALNKFVDEYVDLSWHGKRAQTPDFNADVAREYGEEVGSVELVPQDFGRVLINLLSNAFDAVSELSAKVNGQYAPQVVVSTRRVGGAVEIRVADNGPGIVAEVRERIFEPFFTTKPTGEGTGLGLSLSYDIVAQGHGGTITVESEPGQGAAFVIRIPGTVG